MMRPICMECEEEIKEEFCYMLDRKDVATCICEACVNKAARMITLPVMREVFEEDMYDRHEPTPVIMSDMIA